MKHFGWDITWAIRLFAALVIATPLFLYAPFTGLLLVSAMLLLTGGLRVLQYRRLADWIMVPGTLLQTDIGTYRVSSGQYGRPDAYYFPLAHYAYEYNSVEGESNQYAYDRQSIWSNDIEAIRTLIADLQARQSIDVYVNPAHPNRAVLTTTISAARWSHAWALVASGIILACAGALLWRFS